MRLLREEIVQYCAVDVVLLPELERYYAGILSKEWRKKVEVETLKQVWESQRARYQPNGRHKRLGPWTESIALEDLSCW